MKIKETANVQLILYFNISGEDLELSTCTCSMLVCCKSHHNRKVFKSNDVHVVFLTLFTSHFYWHMSITSISCEDSIGVCAVHQ